MSKSTRALLAAFSFLASAALAQEPAPSPGGEFPIRGRISRAITGADILVAGKSVHIDGTRAPKRGRICVRGGENVDIGSEVADGLGNKLLGAEADLQVHADENGRLVGKGTANGADIGEIAISNGFAVSKIGDPRYARQEREARNNRPGLWSCSSFPKTEQPADVATVAPAPLPLPPPREVKPAPAPPNARGGVEYAPPDAVTPLPPNEPEDDFELDLGAVGNFFEDVFSGIDRGIRDLFGAPPPPPYHR